MSDAWKKLNRELKILLAKQAASGRLHPKDQKRLEWLQERVGDAEEVKRLQIDESVEGGPTTTTSDDHYATELSEDLLEKAEKQKLDKFYEKEARQKKSAIEVKDYRENEETFTQDGLSNFAIEATEDMKGGEISLAEVPEEETQAAQKIDLHRPVYAQDEHDRLAKKEGQKGKSSNPFALDISDGLAAGLDEFKTYDEDLVPDTAAKSFETDMDIGEDEDTNYDQTQIDDDEEVQALYKKSYDLPKVDDPDAASFGERTTHTTGDEEEGSLDADLLMQAVDEAEKKGLVEEEQTWAVDEDGNEVEPAKQFEDTTASFNSPAAKPSPKKRARFGDEAPTTPGVITDNPDDSTTEYDYSLLEQATQAQEKLDGTASGSGRAAIIPDPPAPKPAEVLIPDPPAVTNEAEILIPDPPAPTGETEILIPDPPAVTSETEVLIPDPPEVTDGSDTQISNGPMYTASESDVPDLSDEGDLEVAIEIEAEPNMPPPPPAPAKPGLDIKDRKDLAADEFWGLSDDAPAETVAEEPTSAQTPSSKPHLAAPPPPPPPPPKARKKASRPLPSLSFDPDKAPKATPPPPPKSAQQRVRVLVPDDNKSSEGGGNFLQDLFDDQSESGGGLEPLPGQADRQPAASSAVSVVSAVPMPGRQSPKGGKVNDLSGPRRATVHFKDGVNRRGTIGSIDLDADLLRLEATPGSSAPAEDLVALSLKAIFLLLPRGTAYPKKDGLETKVTMIDGRSLEGFCPDYDPIKKAFTLFPKIDRGNIERIIVFNDAVKNIWFAE
jgi:hypothetical protein